MIVALVSCSTPEHHQVLTVMSKRQHQSSTNDYEHNTFTTQLLFERLAERVRLHEEDHWNQLEDETNTYFKDQIIEVDSQAYIERGVNLRAGKWSLFVST